MKWVLSALPVLFGLLALCLLPMSAPAQIEDPCAWFPLCSGNVWQTDDGPWTVVGARNVNGRTGTIIRFDGGEEDVYYCGPEGFGGIQYISGEPECDRLEIALSEPLLLVIPGAEEGDSWNLSSDIQVNCDGFTDNGTASATVRFVELHETFTVPAGTFTNVIEIRTTGSASALGETLDIDDTYWLAENIGLIQYRNNDDGSTERLVSGNVCGLTIPLPSPTPTFTPAPTPTATPTQPPVQRPWASLFDLATRWEQTGGERDELLGLIEGWGE